MWDVECGMSESRVIRVCLKSHRKSLIHAFGREFPSDAKISNQVTVLTERPYVERIHRATQRAPGFRRLIRDSQNRRLTRDSRIPDFSRKTSGKIVKIGFSDSQDQNQILKI